MMVLRATTASGGNITGAPTAYANAATVFIWPADRCTWTQEVGTGGIGYDIANALFWPGVGLNGGTPDALPLVNPELGFIGKSGRFVKITT